MKKHFKTKVTVDDTEHVFHLEKVKEEDGSVRTVTVTVGDGQYPFSMTKDTKGEWKIITEGLPEWIYRSELYLYEAILDHDAHNKGNRNLLNPWNILDSE